MGELPFSPRVERITLRLREARVVITNRFETGDRGLTKELPIAFGKVAPNKMARAGRSTWCTTATGICQKRGNKRTSK